MPVSKASPQAGTKTANTEHAAAKKKESQVPCGSGLESGFWLLVLQIKLKQATGDEQPPAPRVCLVRM